MRHTDKFELLTLYFSTLYDSNKVKIFSEYFQQYFDDNSLAYNKDSHTIIMYKYIYNMKKKNYKF